MPRHIFRPSRAQDFHDRLLGGKANGISLSAAATAGVGVAALTLCEAARRERFAVLIEQTGNARDLHDVDAVPYDPHGAHRTRHIAAMGRQHAMAPLSGAPMHEPMSDAASSHLEHAAAHSRANPVRCAILTISDRRTMEDDESGSLMERLLTSAGHLPIARTLVRDDPPAIESQLRQWIDDPSVQVILSTGGTGVSARDNTIDIVRRLLTIELEGFGELFRMLSFQEIQGAAMLSRAAGGLVIAATPASDRDGAVPRAETDSQASRPAETFLFAMPGSTNAVKLAMKQLIVPQLAHLVWERHRHRVG